LLSVHCDSDDWVKRAKDILRETGAQDIASAGEARGDFANADKPMPRSRSMGSDAAEAIYVDEPVSTTTTTPIRRRPNTDLDDTKDL
jgi:hypothetical protein